MQNTLINLKAIAKVASALGKLNAEAVFVGGAIISIYADDPAAVDVRPTKDIDIFMQITTVSRLESIRQGLTAKGFSQTSADNVICRFRLDDLKVDVMSTHEVGWAPANRWFALGIDNVRVKEIMGYHVRHLTLPYYLAAKFDAFNGRGTDPRTSHDFEDIVYLLNYCTSLEDEISSTEPEVRSYLIQQFNEIIEKESLQEAVHAQLYFEDKEARLKLIMETLKSIVQNN